MASVVDLISRGYFPKELPPPFSTATFGDLLNNDPSFSFTSTPGSHEFQLAHHSLSRAGTLRRQLAVPNPVPFLELAQCLSSNWPSVEKQCRRSSISLSPPDTTSSDRAVVAGTPIGHHPIHRASLRATSRYILQTDISNCYSSIYTHAISWALHTKAKAKARRTDMKLLGNQLDRLVRNGQYGQTIGVPTGPDTSLVIAEMLLSSVDEAFCLRLAKQKLQANGFRSYDDFEFGFDSRADAESAAALLQQTLSEYELQLNASKTAIVKLAVPVESAWVSEIRMFQLRDKPSSWDINRYFDRAFELARLYPDADVLKYAIQRLRAADVSDEQWPLVEDHLLQCAMVEPSSLPAVVDHLHYYRNQGSPLNLAKIRTAFNLLMKLHAPLRHGSEVAWALWGCLLFRLSIEVPTTPLASMEDPFVSLLLLHAQDVNLTRRKLSNTRWWGHLNIKSLQEEMWPLAYEANVKGWISSKSDYVSADPRFGPLKANNVSFYDTSKVKTLTPSKVAGFPWSSGGDYPD